LLASLQGYQPKSRGTSTVGKRYQEEQSRPCLRR
jgi:hypothetical protein